MGKIGFNDLSTEVAMQICNKFRIEKSIHTIDKNTISVPINIEFDPKLDELIVIKNSTVLSAAEYKFSENGTHISPVNVRAWEASKIYTVEFNFIVLKSVLPGTSAAMWRNTYTIKAPTRGVPITVQGFDGKSDSILVVKNGTVLANDEYEIKDGILYPGGDVDNQWEATAKIPVHFDFIVFKHSHMQKGVINGFHIQDGTINMDALHPDIRNTLNLVTFMSNRLAFLLDAIDKYGNYELRTYIAEHIDKPEDATKKMIEEATVKYNKAVSSFYELGDKIEVKHREVMDKLQTLGMIKDLSNAADLEGKTKLKELLVKFDLLKKEPNLDFWKLSADKTVIKQIRRDGLGYHNYSASTGEFINSTSI
jgi:hypothetical protein